jgi:hypothetical protein
MFEYDTILWQNYLKEKFGDKVPETFIVNLGEIDFCIPPLLGINPESFKAIQKHNAKKSIF